MARPPKSCATKFLYFVAFCIILFIAGAFAYRFLEKQLMAWALVPGTEFRDVPMPQGANYGQASLWIARPDIANNPSLWLPPGVQRSNVQPRASIFLVFRWATTSSSTRCRVTRVRMRIWSHMPGSVPPLPASCQRKLASRFGCKAGPQLSLG